MIEKKAAIIADKEISFLCPERCGKEKLKFNQIGPHNMWFCEKREIVGKKSLLGRNYHLQEQVKANSVDLEA